MLQNSDLCAKIFTARKPLIQIPSQTLFKQHTKPAVDATERELLGSEMTSIFPSLIFLLLATLWMSADKAGAARHALLAGSSPIGSAEFSNSRHKRVKLVDGNVEWCINSPSSSADNCGSSQSALNVEIDNNMVAMDAKYGGFIVGCVAYTVGHGEVPEDLGGAEDPPVQPMHYVQYYLNLEFLTPTQIACTFDWAGEVAGNKTVVLYDADNVALQSLNIRWGVDERGFSLFDTTTQMFNLHETW